MHATSGILALLFVLATAACSSLEVKTETLSNVDFAALRTFDWLPDTKAGDKRFGPDYEFLDPRIHQAVEKELKARGYRRVTDEVPDFYVDYSVFLETVFTPDQYEQWRDWSHRQGTLDESSAPEYGISQAAPREHDQGTLMIMMIDPENNRQIWQGSVETLVERSNNPDKAGKRIDKVVKQIIKRIPGA